jgi:hypothetical protein
MGVLVDDDSGVKARVSPGGAISPKVHPHSARRAICRCGKVGIVSAAAILRVQDDEIVATTALAIVVDLKVSSSLVETQKVQEIVILVGCVKQLRDGGITVRDWVSLRSGKVVLKLEALAVWAVVVEVCTASRRVHVGNSIVASSRRVVCRTIRQPSELGCRDVPRVLDNASRAL